MIINIRVPKFIKDFYTRDSWCSRLEHAIICTLSTIFFTFVAVFGSILLVLLVQFSLWVLLFYFVIGVVFYLTYNSNSCKEEIHYEGVKSDYEN